MAEINDLAQKLLELDEDELEARIGMRSQSQSRGGEAEVADDSLDSLEDMDAVPRGAFNDFLAAGKDFFTPVNAQAYKILCTEIGNDSELGKALNNVMDIKTTEAAAKVTAILSPILVSQLALPQSLAVLVGTLIVKKVAKGASDFTCSNWKKALEGETPAQDAAPANG
jgi:hypothetical protein